MKKNILIITLIIIVLLHINDIAMFFTILSSLYTIITNSLIWTIISNILICVGIISVISYFFYFVFVSFFKKYLNRRRKILNEKIKKDGKISIDDGDDKKDVYKTYYEYFINDIVDIFNSDKEHNILLYKGDIPTYYKSIEVYMWNSLISRVSLFNTNVKLLLFVKYQNNQDKDNKDNKNGEGELYFVETELSDFSLCEKFRLMYNFVISFSPFMSCLSKCFFGNKNKEILRENSKTKVLISYKIFNELTNKLVK